MPNPTATVFKTGRIWIPPRVFKPNWKVEITRTDGTVDDVTNDMLSGSVTLTVTQATGRFNMNLDNRGGLYLNRYNGGEVISIYGDYSDASNKMFEGRLSDVFYSLSGNDGYVCSVSGKDYSAEALDITVTKRYTTNTAISTIFKEVVDEYLPTFTYNNVQTITTTARPTWSNKPAWDCFKELAILAGRGGTDHDFYSDSDKDWNFFEEGANVSTLEAVVIKDNLKNISIGTSFDDIKNRIIVYGQQLEGLPLIAYAENEASQNTSWIKERVITDTNIVTYEHAQDRADSELEDARVPLTKGTVNSVGLPFLKPGDMLRVVAPYCGATGQFKVTSLTHSFSKSAGFTTSVSIKREPRVISKIFQEQTDRQQGLQDINNQFEMQYSYNLTFDSEDEIESHSGTALSDGKLVLASGQTSGIMISEERLHTSNITQIEFKVNGSDDLRVSSYFISVDGGGSWELVTPNTLHTVAGTGRRLKVRIRLLKDSDNPNPEIESQATLYKS